MPIGFAARKASQHNYTRARRQTCTSVSFQARPRQIKSPRRLQLKHASIDTTGYAEAYRLRTQNGHDAAFDRYRQLLLQNPQDTSAATRMAASEYSLRSLARVGVSYSQLNEDVDKLHNLLNLTHYCHSSIRKHIFNLPTGITNDVDGFDSQSMGRYKNDYPMGPTYVRPLVAGQGLDLSKLIDTRSGTGSTSDTWLPSLQCLATLFLLSSCIPKQFFLKHVIGGRETLELFLRLGIVFVFDAKQELGTSGEVEEEWVVPLVHLFPLEIPPIRSSDRDANNDEDRQKLVLLTDLHPTVLGMTTIPKMKEGTSGGQDEEGTVMYIGPDSMALVQHLHASMLQYTESQNQIKSPIRILDVCTGSGIQALSTLAMLDSLKCNAWGAVAVDINERAIRFTRLNAQLNGFNEKLFTIHADVLSGKVYAKHKSVEALKYEDGSLTEALLKKLVLNEQQQTTKHELKFDIILANPPFIPVPPARSDDASLSIRREDNTCKDTSTPYYGLFSSGGASGEDCLRAIIQMAPSLLRPDGGLLAVVSEFMNPPPPSSALRKNEDEEGANHVLTYKIDEWWGSQPSDGIIFTNEHPLSFDIYAERRATTNDQEDIKTWKTHLIRSEIHSVSPGLLFVQTKKGTSLQNQNGLTMKQVLVPKTKSGSIWTPHNVDAVDFTKRMLSKLFQRSLTT